MKSCFSSRDRAQLGFSAQADGWQCADAGATALSSSLVRCFLATKQIFREKVRCRAAHRQIGDDFHAAVLQASPASKRCNLSHTLTHKFFVAR